MCNQFTNPLFNIGSHSDQKWVKVDGEEVRMTNRPQEFVPQSHSKAEQIVTKKADIFSNKQKSEFKIVNLIENTRQLLTEEIIHHMSVASDRSPEQGRLFSRSTAGALMAVLLHSPIGIIG